MMDLYLSELYAYQISQLLFTLGTPPFFQMFTPNDVGQSYLTTPALEMSIPY